MSPPDLRSVVVDVLSVTLRVSADGIGDDFSPAQCETWDSVRHLMIMLAIEEKFSIAFGERELSELVNVAGIVSAVRAHLAGE
jgi:acyl carrier protein